MLVPSSNLGAFSIDNTWLVWLPCSILLVDCSIQRQRIEDLVLRDRACDGCQMCGMRMVCWFWLCCGLSVRCCLSVSLSVAACLCLCPLLPVCVCEYAPSWYLFLLLLKHHSLYIHIHIQSNKPEISKRSTNAGISVFLFFRRARNIINWVLRYILFCIIYIMGSLQRLNLRGGAIPLRIEDTKYPVVVFSHGLAGNKTMYSILCSELASQGYVVLALEHADGTASVAKIAGKRGTYRFYEGLGGEVGQYDKTRHRVKEMKTAYQILRRMNKGGHIEGLKLSHGAHESGFLEGCIDMRCIAAIGHSYGGATVAALCCEDPLYRLGVCLDPWWPAVPPESSAFSSWRTKSPLLVIGSHDWYVCCSSFGGFQYIYVLKCPYLRVFLCICICASIHTQYITIHTHISIHAGIHPMPTVCSHVMEKNRQKSSMHAMFANRKENAMEAAPCWYLSLDPLITPLLIHCLYFRTKLIGFFVH